ncbi:serine hydrolase [Elizabethkingia anophelis]|uniref:Beta-lactamase-related domain-containing protein n=1 Tax=Elizabethkingia anophelis TaxID=1117645 RepID=A0AAE4SZZ9_9FLAO|nr:serine hydrolase domain-containing protein [Elizabethkingia anophelis]AQX02010.1 hypothetical protein BBD32_11300 [Elizabethkingia anophelis]MCT3699177.1 beta-lactamase family protein [Elizabethkingia anophelis]MCT4288558.1 beta-lactamase family protein [Elizabethkingia anophelis]MCT4296187.1 beta-lactamase family protein [Elizabethkingia anophelis]MCT4299321.1 beta-lactamase family protein [Elizabethkingia anophelis]
MKIYTILFFSILISLSSCRSNSDTNPQTKLNTAVATLHTDLEKAISTDVPSLSVYVISPKGTYFSSVTGKNGTPVTKDTYFRFASNTKNFTATAILNMMQDGWLNLDDKITGNIPGTNIPYVPNTAEWNFPNKDLITIKQLLQHNAGIYDLTNDTSKYSIDNKSYDEYMLENFPNMQFTTEQYVKILTEKKLSYGLPNTVYHYSNTGYSILGEIIARIYSAKTNTNKTYGNYMNDKIIGSSARIPLNIKFVEEASDQQLPSPYITGYIHYDDRNERTDKKNATAHIAEGNGIGTMTELAKYIRTTMKAENVLTTQSVQLMKNSIGKATTPQDNNYALGCFHIPGIGYGHNGATEGYLSLMLHDPDTDITTIVLLPFWDLSQKAKNFNSLLLTLNKTAFEAKKALGY